MTIATGQTALAADVLAAIGTVSASKVVSTATSASRTLADRFAAVFDIMDFAVGGYVVGSGGDDRPAFAAVLSAAAAALPAGGIVTLPSSTILLSAGITIPANVLVRGQGVSTTISPSTTMTTMITMPGSFSGLQDVLIANISSRATNAVAIGKGYDNAPLDIDSVRITGFTRSVWVTSGDVIHIDRLASINHGTAIAIDNGMMNSSITRCYLLNGNGIDIAVPTAQEPEGLTITGGLILPITNGDFGIRIRSGLSLHIRDNIIDQIKKTGANGILIDAQGFGVRNVHIASNWFGINGTAAGTGGSQMKIISGAASGIYLTNSTFDHAGSYGLEVTAPVVSPGVTTDLVVLGCRFQSSTTGDVFLNSCRATFIGTEFNHATATIVTFGGQASYSDFGCPNNGAAFQAPTLADTSIPTMHLSPGQNVKLYQQLVVGTGGADITGSSVVRLAGGSTTIADSSTTGTTHQFQVSGTANPNIGAAIALLGNGTNATKGIRALGGLLQFTANDLTTILATLDNAGVFIPIDLRIGGTDQLATAWTSQSGAVTSSAGSGLTATGTVRTKKVGRMVHVQVKVTVSSLGTGSGFVAVALPYTAAAFDQTLSGKDTNSAKALSGNIAASGTSVGIHLYDGTYPIASTSTVLVVEGVYESAT